MSEDCLPLLLKEEGTSQMCVRQVQTWCAPVGC
jgi:hypothetical protein